MLRRRSERTFLTAPVSHGDLGLIAANGFAAHRNRLQAAALPVRLKLWLAIPPMHVEGKIKTFLYDPETNSLVPNIADSQNCRLEDLVLQQSLAKGAAMLLITGDFHDAQQVFGARGYRELLSHAGSIAARSLLAATRLGISGCIWGGLLEDGWGRLLHIDRYGDCPLLGVTLGYPHASS